jgi:hypothetical protein
VKSFSCNHPLIVDAAASKPKPLNGSNAIDSVTVPALVAFCQLLEEKRANPYLKRAGSVQALAAMSVDYRVE